MANVLASSSVDRWFELRSVKAKTIKLVFVASPLSLEHYGGRAKTGWSGNQDNVSECGEMSVRVNCPSTEVQIGHDVLTMIRCSYVEVIAKTDLRSSSLSA